MADYSELAGGLILCHLSYFLRCDIILDGGLESSPNPFLGDGVKVTGGEN